MEAATAAANFARMLSAVRRRHESFEILEQGVVCARLVPAAERQGNSHDLADDLASSELPGEERHALAAALHKGKTALKPLWNPWG
jgi:antitoxin (DNA-binding transcriptional repressor) of toxin-antitoxin stability system